MRMRSGPVLAFLAFGLLVALSPNGGAVAADSAPDVAATLGATLGAAHFAEPLATAAPTSPEEDVALVKAVTAYEHRWKTDDADSLTGFLAQYPKSGWAPALWTNLGLSYLHDGHFSLAIAAWKQAWTLGKNASDPQAKAMVDRAVGELARLYASLGQVDNLKALIDDIGSRPVTGSATETLQGATETLSLLGKDPGHLFNCGPVALRFLMLARDAHDKQGNFLPFVRVGADGASFADLVKLGDQAKLSSRVVFRQPGQPTPVPSVVHWKVGHFGAITSAANGRYHVEDPVFPGAGLWVTQASLDAEASGYFLIPASLPVNTAWRTVDGAEAGTIRGKGATSGTPPGGGGGLDPDGGGGDGGSDGGDDGGGGGCPMCGYNIRESTVGITLSDTPVGYAPPIGPSAKVKITYNQREDSQPANFSFSNVSPKWTLNWFAYVTDDPTNPGANVSRYLAAGGAYYYTGYNGATGQFAAQYNDGSILVLASQGPVAYRRQLPNGGVEIYAQSDGGAAYPRHIFLSQLIDPQGNSVTLSYDSQHRLTTLTDAVGRQTTFAYGLAGQPLLVTQITDPFGRGATLAYDFFGRLTSITDIIGITSRFTYDANSLVNSLTTPYGVTSFAYTAPGASGPPRFAQATDPLGYSERVEWLEPAPIPDSDSAATVPQGMSVSNQYLSYRNSFFWDKNAYVAAGCTPTGGCDYTKARDRHFAHVPNTSLKSNTVESVKYPLENRIWFNYPGQTLPYYAGTSRQPTITGRVLDDGTTQLTQESYDTAGFFKLLQTVDPLGRATSQAYSNQIDLAAISQTTAYGLQVALVQSAYNIQHLPVSVTDSSGQTSTFTYTPAGQLASKTNALGQTTRYQYNATGDLTLVINANGATAGSYTYDAFDRVATFTDSEGRTVGYTYDAADRVTQITYPDGTTNSYVYGNLDLLSHRDRQGRTWTYAYDADRRLITTTDPLGQQTHYAYSPTGRRTGLTDPGGNTTSWAYDLENRLTTKTFADGRTLNYTYEATTSRLKSVTDSLGQTKQFIYAKDDRITGVGYSNALNPTPSVTLAYDPYFPRVVSMTDGVGVTTYAYVPVGSLGALQRQQESVPLSGGGAISYAYDALGRLVTRTVGGAGPETFQYDALGRLTGHSSDLGAFTLTYLGQTDQITGRQLANSTLATTWSYLPNSGDRRLAGINNTGLSSAQSTAYQFTTTPENFITAIAETSDQSIPTPPTAQQTASYNALNQLANLSGQALSWDANGNLLSDGGRAYSWDAENRLIGIAYPGQTGKQTAFAYDGLGRRVAITSTPAGGGSAVATSYVWCGDSLCQARNVSGAPTRGYYAEGELASGQPVYYGVDQLGSTRRAFATASNAPAYGYDPYGNPLQSTAPLTDFGYAGMFANADSGLYLTKYRAYDPVSGRWLSRDPIGESGGINLYAYVDGNPLSYVDPDGYQKIPVPLDPEGLCLPYNYSPRLDSKTDIFHNYPFSYDTQILEFGNLTINNPIQDRNVVYKQYNIQGYVNGKFGEFQLGIEFPMNGNNQLPTVTHRLFSPY